MSLHSNLPYQQAVLIVSNLSYTLQTLQIAESITMRNLTNHLITVCHLLGLCTLLCHQYRQQISNKYLDAPIQIRVHDTYLYFTFWCAYSSFIDATFPIYDNDFFVDISNYHQTLLTYYQLTSLMIYIIFAISLYREIHIHSIQTLLRKPIYRQLFSSLSGVYFPDLVKNHFRENTIFHKEGEDNHFLYSGCCVHNFILSQCSTIPAGMLERADILDNFYISSHVEKISTYAFYGAQLPKNLLFHPQSGLVISSYAFAYTNRLTDLSIYAKGDLIIETHTFCHSVTLEKLTLSSDSRISISSFAFLGCKELRDLVISTPKTAFHPEAFSKNTSLINVILSDSFYNFQLAYFSHLPKLKKLIIGNNTYQTIQNSSEFFSTPPTENPLSQPITSVWNLEKQSLFSLMSYTGFMTSIGLKNTSLTTEQISDLMQIYHHGVPVEKVFSQRISNLPRLYNKLLSSNSITVNQWKQPAHVILDAYRGLGFFTPQDAKQLYIALCLSKSDHDQNTSALSTCKFLQKCATVNDLIDHIQPR